MANTFIFSLTFSFIFTLPHPTIYAQEVFVLIFDFFSKS